MITNRIDNTTNNLQKMVERPIEALHFSPCYKIVPALNRMFGRLQTDSVTELRQISEFARLAFLITFCGFTSVLKIPMKKNIKGIFKIALKPMLCLVFFIIFCAWIFN